MNLPGMTIVFDNDPGLPGFPTLWGFAAVIQTPARSTAIPRNKRWWWIAMA